MLAVGGLLDRVHRAGRGGLHGPVERQPGLDIDGKPDHVHRLLGRFHRAHMLCVHVVKGREPKGTGPREPVRAGPADHPRRRQHGAGRRRTHTGRQLHIHGVLQDDLPGDRVRRHARLVPVAGTPLAVRAGRVQPPPRRRGEAPPVSPPPSVRHGHAAPVLHTTPVAITPSREPGAAGLRPPQDEPARVQLGQLETGQGHGPGHVGGLQREQLVQVPAEAQEGGGGG